MSWGQFEFYKTTRTNISVYITVYGCFLKWWYPQIIHFNRVFHYKPSILGCPYFGNTHMFTLIKCVGLLISVHFIRWVFRQQHHQHEHPESSTINIPIKIPIMVKEVHFLPLVFDSLRAKTLPITSQQ